MEKRSAIPEGFIKCPHFEDTGVKCALKKKSSPWNGCEAPSGVCTDLRVNAIYIKLTVDQEDEGSGAEEVYIPIIPYYERPAISSSDEQCAL